MKNYFALISISSFLIVITFLGCTKTENPLPTTPNPTPITGMDEIPIKYLEITYPFANPYSKSPKIRVNFSLDSVVRPFEKVDIFTVETIDSLNDNGALYGRLETKRSYFYTRFPKRFTNSTFRSQHLAELSIGPSKVPFLNYDVKIDYPNNAPGVGNLTTTGYSDYGAMQPLWKFSILGTTYPTASSTGYYSTDSFKYIDLYRNGAGTVLMVKQDNSFYQLVGEQKYEQAIYDSSEVSLEYCPFAPYYYLFFKSSAGTPNNKYTFHRYDYNKQGYCKTYTVVQGYNGMIGNTDANAKHKITYTYDSDTTIKANVIRRLYDMSVLYYQKLAYFQSPLPRAYDSFKETYYPEPYTIYRDLSSSYTDSSFSVDASMKQQFISATKFTNTIERDPQGRIKKIKRNDSAGRTVKIIEVFY